MRVCFPPLLFLTLIVSSSTASDDWPQFRGPNGQGHSDATGLPLTWSETENIAWKTATAGRGWSSPVVLGEQIWITTAVETAATIEEKMKRLAGRKHEDSLEVAKSVTLRAVCIHRGSGRLLHDVELFHVDNPEPIHKLNSFASPTPVVEPGRVWCDFGTFGTACLDSATGKILWKRRLPIEHEVGPGSSPVLYMDLVVLVRDGCDVQYVAGLEKNTGRTVWKTDRPEIEMDDEFKKGFSTPLVIESAGREQMVVPGAQWVVSYDPATGEPIWRANYGKGYSNVPRPVFGHGLVYVCTEGPGRQLWAIRVDGRGDVTDTHVAWISKKQISKRTSPLLVGDEIYLITDTGVATCLDARTGQAHWQKRLGGNYFASPVFADGRIYFFNDESKTIVLRPGKEFVKLAENHLEGRLVASPAIAGKAIFLRTDTHLYRIEIR